VKNRFKHLAVLLILAATMTAACGPVPFGVIEKTVYVGPEMVDCVGVAPQKCLLVKENLEDDWTSYYDQIEGFAYEPGYEYELRVLEQKIEDPPADASTIKWTLAEIVSKTAVPQPGAGLEGTAWTLDTYVSSQGQTVSTLPDTEVMAKFQAGELGGNAGCNSYFGQYELDGNSLTVGPVAMTEMYCLPEELMAQESDYLAALQRVASYQITNGQLQLSDAGGEPLLTFSILQPTSLVGTLWQLTAYYNGKDGFVSVLLDTEVMATFGEDGKLSGSAGCNNYSASYEVTGDQITIGPAAATMMMCPTPEGIMEQEGAYLAALESATAFQLEGKNLTMTNAEGMQVLTYTVREPTPLIGTLWQLGWYNNGRGGFTSVMAGTEITAVFTEEGNVSGSAGCNNYMGSYQVDATASPVGGAISVGPAAATRMMCNEPEGIMQQESEYLAALESAASYEIQADKLVLANAEGARVAEFYAQELAAGPSEALSEEALRNLEVQSEWTQSGTAPLTNGEYREPAAPGSATETIVRLTGPIAYGQLNGQDVAAAVLVTDPGGSGTFYELAVVAEQDGQPVHIASALLGDRVQINSVAIENNQIVVDMISHGPDDPLCCPTQAVVQTYELQGDQLLPTTSQGTGLGTDAGLDIVGVVWKWERFLESNDNTVIVPNPDSYTLEFLPDGQVQILADCNRVGGSYTVSGSLLTIELGPSTKAACPPGSLSDEYLRLLQDVNSYMVDGDNLALAIKYDTGIMAFAPGK
jgi:heat shock protein HslJ